MCFNRPLIVSVVFLALVGAPVAASGQAAAAYSAATRASTESAANVSGKIIKLVTPKTGNKGFSSRPTANKKGASHLALRADTVPLEERNRRALEEKAGAEPSSLLLRSNPNHAKVWVDGKLVGKTPILLILPPGAFNIEMRGPRMEYGRRKVDILPKEKRTLLFPLNPPYPARVRIQ